MSGRDEWIHISEVTDDGTWLSFPAGVTSGEPWLPARRRGLTSWFTNWLARRRFEREHAKWVADGRPPLHHRVWVRRECVSDFQVDEDGWVSFVTHPLPPEKVLRYDDEHGLRFVPNEV